MSSLHGTARRVALADVVTEVGWGDYSVRVPPRLLPRYAWTTPVVRLGPVFAMLEHFWLLDGEEDEWVYVGDEGAPPYLSGWDFYAGSPWDR